MIRVVAVMLLGLTVNGANAGSRLPDAPRPFCSSPGAILARIQAVEANVDQVVLTYEQRGKLSEGNATLPKLVTEHFGVRNPVVLSRAAAGDWVCFTQLSVKGVRQIDQLSRAEGLVTEEEWRLQLKTRGAD